MGVLVEKEEEGRRFKECVGPNHSWEVRASVRRKVATGPGGVGKAS